MNTNKQRHAFSHNHIYVTLVKFSDLYIEYSIRIRIDHPAGERSACASSGESEVAIGCRYSKQREREVDVYFGV
ncbi:MAG: hypothetical protein P4L81_03510 [Candidatus Pacebacteria bacterium]|nr:hypothetical protein [Candidatus Paceibacterota bacterium]